MKDHDLITVAIESSCDETAAAVVKNGRDVVSNVVSSQIDIHKKYGGVVPEIASRHHLDNINYVVEKAFEEAGIRLEDVDLIGVTMGPGLVGALLIGLATAKAFAFAAAKPLVGVNHIHAHICANYIEHRDLEPPFIALVVSGGHTNIVNVAGYNEYEILGSTRDDAAGEAYDKVARILGLGYPGGPEIDRIARQGAPNAVEFKRVFLEKGSYDFSFSGIKTGVMNHVNNEKQRGKEINIPDIAAGFQEAVLDVITVKTVNAALSKGQKKIAAAGGVMANTRLREMLSEECEKHGIGLYYPSPRLCTDNAVMVGSAAYYKYVEKGRDDLYLDAVPNLGI